ncbi:GDP-mannose 4,6-dehydratase [Methanonatronarchaeum sp. AMET-Sl]|uniref:GDP-mannose 4,6-dehydratase n=1 Tax=Methanonatronarchaeum sp. AMET-Sl TaxID=3037654 RepID=UPI00244DA2EF|nr:GDP-mannose 4,6-dehydratase [Methanonatronarchaeum sp. AMET-Sl]WGI17677.1 GDP-mannose 4,6-dehydratase [Methanonatronarchaeum sp. AMET-Sl]
MDVLVTGGAGFIGSHLTMGLLDKGLDVVVLDNLNDYYSPEIKEKNLELCRDRANETDGGLEFIEGDVRNRDLVEGVFGRFGFDVVFHEAAQAGVRYSVENPLEPDRVNVEGTLNLLEASVDYGVGRFINASSSSVYGETEYLPFDEKHPKTPRSPYGVSKLASEQYTRVYHELYDINTISLRYFTVYGPRMRPDMAISNFTKNCLNQKPPQIYGDGQQTRDFTYIDDVVKANLKLLDNKKGYGEPINIGSNQNITIEQLAQKIIDITGYQGKPKYTNKKKGDARHTYADITKAKQKINYQPTTTLQQGLKKYKKWLKNNKNWYKPQKP